MKTRLITAAVAALVLGGFAGHGVAYAANESPAAVGSRSDDATLIAKIKTNLLRSPEAAGMNVIVDVREGVVTLSGTADSATGRASAEKIARISDGVKRVDNRIAVRPVAQASTLPAMPAASTPAALSLVPPPAN